MNGVHIPFSGLWIPIWNIHGLAFLASAIILSFWIRLQYAREVSGFYSSDQQVIFPIYLHILVSYLFARLFHGIMLAAFFGIGIHEGFEWAICNGVSWFLQNTVLRKFLLCSTSYSFLMF
jgi:hypothetical protein